MIIRYLYFHLKKMLADLIYQVVEIHAMERKEVAENIIGNDKGIDDFPKATTQFKQNKGKHLGRNITTILR